ncbi:hypothetical protein ACT8ZV_18850 [Nocardioides sp. MAHUQ-72]|uniref:hypothetical protein n=1 Tax=unclassified Nocardioides TaxID=2615069 RepID=UPI00360C3C03
MTTNQAQPPTIPVVDVDQAFPAMVETPARSVAVPALDQGPAVRTAIRNVLGVRSREQDPKAFVDALTAAFRLVRVEGHVESQFVPRGYAIQADLGAVSGGQASLYRRATIARAEILRILDGLTPLRTDGDLDDMEAYRVIVRNSVQSLVDEMGLPGGPRVAMVDSYFDGLVGRGDDDADGVGGQLGALRERFGLVDDNVNTIEEEGRRTAFWTLVDLVRDLRSAWGAQRGRFSGTAGNGFLGTELIHVSRLMDAAADQVEELETVLDSVLIGSAERQTIPLDNRTNLTLDGLLSWLSAFLHDEGRRLAQDAGRDGIVAALAPTAVALADTFKRFLADPLLPTTGDEDEPPVRYLPASCCHDWPPGMYAARVQIAVASLCRLLFELARRAQRIGRWAGVVLVDISVSSLGHTVPGKSGKEAVNVEFRGLNLRSTYEPAFVPRKLRRDGDGCRVETLNVRKLVRPIPGTVTADDESISGLFRYSEIAPILEEAKIWIASDGAVFPAADAPVAIIDSETGRAVHAPVPTTWPRLVRADRPAKRPQKKLLSRVGPDPGGGRTATTSPPSGRLGENAARWRRTHPPSPPEEAGNAVGNADFVRRTLAEMADRVTQEHDRAEAEYVVAAGEFEEARRRFEALRAEIEDVRLEREQRTGSPKSALTRKLTALEDDAGVEEARLQDLAETAAARQEELAVARRMRSLLDEARGAGESVHGYLQAHLEGLSEADTNEEGH